MKKRRFIKLPEFPGGKKEFQQYVLENLRYPPEAQLQKVEGVVHLEAVVDDNGRVSAVHVIKGVGYGCDEEAIRLIQSARFGSVNNKGVRVKSTRKFRVEFSLRSELQKKPTGQEDETVSQIVYNFVPTKKVNPEESKGSTLSYSIDL